MLSMVLHIPFDFSKFKNIMYQFYVLSARFENPLRQVKGNGFYNITFHTFWHRIQIKVDMICMGVCVYICKIVWVTQFLHMNSPEHFSRINIYSPFRPISL